MTFGIVLVALAALVILLIWKGDFGSSCCGCEPADARPANRERPPAAG